MLTKVKMQVTPKINEKVQKIVFNNKGTWRNGSMEIFDTYNGYIFINENMKLTRSASYEVFDECEDEEVCPYAFIASNGKEKELPIYGEEIEVSDNKNEWTKAKFKVYMNDKQYPIYSELGCHKYWRYPKKQISFKEFLEENGVNWDIFLTNCKIENQRWSFTNLYTTIRELKQLDQIEWIARAFNWNYALQKDKYFWSDLNNEWINLINNTEKDVVWE